jgi:hypothetical protein
MIYERLPDKVINSIIDWNHINANEGLCAVREVKEWRTLAFGEKCEECKGSGNCPCYVCSQFTKPLPCPRCKGKGTTMGLIELLERHVVPNDQTKAALKKLRKLDTRELSD